MRRKRYLIFSGLSLFFVLTGFFLFDLMKNPVRFSNDPYIVELDSTFDTKDPISFVFAGNKEDVQVLGSVDSQCVGTYSLQYIFKNKKISLVVKVKDTKPPIVKTKNIRTDMVNEVKPNDFIESIQDASKTKTTIKNPENLKQKGRTRIQIEVVDSYKNKITKEVTLTRIQDKEPPKIENMQSLTVMQGLPVDLNKDFHYKDNMDENCKKSIDDSKLNLKQPGKYLVRYTVTDRSKNKSTFEREIYVKKNPEYGKKIVYLTFDDGPSENTLKILKILKKYKVKATFFVTGNHPEFNTYLKQAHEQGHTIALHTFTHHYKDVYASKKSYYKDLKKVSDMVKSVTGEESKLIRFPGGSSNTVSSEYTKGIMSDITKELVEQGYQYFDWNVDSTDASGNNVPVDTLVNNSIGYDYPIINILMHDTKAKETTIEALPQIIKYYKQQGYTFHELTQNSIPIHHSVQN